MAINTTTLSLFPDLPRNPHLVDKNGQLTPDWKLFLEQTIQVLQTNLKPEGFVIPKQPTSNISLLTDTASVSNILYDTTINQFKGNVQTSPSTSIWKIFSLI